MRVLGTPSSFDSRWKPPPPPPISYKTLGFGGKRHTRMRNKSVVGKHWQSESIPLTLQMFTAYYNTGSNWLFIPWLFIVSWSSI